MCAIMDQLTGEACVELCREISASAMKTLDDELLSSFRLYLLRGKRA